MAGNNNCLRNAAFTGFMTGALSGRVISSPLAASYLKLKDAANAFAGQVDAAIPFDATITTSAMDPSMLVSTGSNTIQSNTQVKPTLLQGICCAAMEGRFSEDATPSDYTSLAAACAAAYTEGLLGLVSP